MPLGYGETRNEVTPDRNEEIVIKGDICGTIEIDPDPCSFIS
jgi:hypothetical protein